MQRTVDSLLTGGSSSRGQGASDIQRRYLSIVVSDPFLDRTIEAILKSGSTDNVGDGKIFVSEIKEAYRIRTGEKGNESLN